MDSDSSFLASGGAAAVADEPQRVKFLCSFGGSVFPRPLDGHLRYVGGDTRIVSVPRDVSFPGLMARMRVLFDAASVIKYQQPEEDLDALVSVVNDDDVANMLEEYDKLGAPGEFSVRLRVFLFSPHQAEIDAAAAASAAPLLDADEREAERRYVDALNSLSDTNIPLPPSAASDPAILSADGAVHPQLHRLNIPQPSRYTDVDASWSPAYYSPSHGHSAHHDPREHSPSSPSVPRHIGIGEFSDWIPDEYTRQPVGHQHEHHSPTFAATDAWHPHGSAVVQENGFPGNLGPHVAEGRNICENCRRTFKQACFTMPDSRYPDQTRMHAQQPYTEPRNAGNDNMFLNSCAECYRGPEFYNHVVYGNPHALHQHQLASRFGDLRMHSTGTNRADHYVVDYTPINKIPYPQGHVYDAHTIPLNSNSPEMIHYQRPANGAGYELLHAQQLAGGTHVHTMGIDDTTTRYANFHPKYAMDSLHPYYHNVPPPVQPMRRSPHSPAHPGPAYETGLTVTNDSICSSPKVDERILNTQVTPNDITLLNEPSSHENLCKMGSYIAAKEIQQPVCPASVQCNPDTVDAELTGGGVLIQPCSSLDSSRVICSPCDQQPPAVDTEQVAECRTNDPNMNISTLTKKDMAEHDVEGLRPTEGGNYVASLTTENTKISTESLSFLPDVMASVKKAVLEGAVKLKSRAEANPDSCIQDAGESEPPPHDIKARNVDTEAVPLSDNEHSPKIEPCAAETEALAKGLQTIRNADLEEIRKLGLGAFGAVYHGKWRGSDVAIKRIKASCFDGKPSVRERLIADFWHEALILSSLHHPNIVSFYGVVRDAPGGSLATVTEFMVNGSLRQFLQKKDRTIDRRKRLMLAMDAAFGMEYLHGKNIVHFDLKCENLLVNMRDPHRPICKIGDLGLSKVKRHTFVSGGVRGSLPWMAPELLSGKSNMVTENIDVYSFGIVMWELLTGEEPYAGVHCASIIGGILNNTLRPQIPTWCDPEWKSLMESCWNADPAKRPSFSEISQTLRNMSSAMSNKP